MTQTKLVNGERVEMTEEEAAAFEASRVLDPAAELAAWRGQASLPRTTFCANLLAAGILPPAEAVEATKGNWPATFDAALVSLTETEATLAQIEWAGATTIRRNHPMIATLAALAGLTETQVDALFGRTPPA